VKAAELQDLLINPANSTCLHGKMQDYMYIMGFDGWGTAFLR